MDQSIKVSDKGRAFIQRREGYRSHAYNDGYGTWTIGYGHTKGVTAGQTCNETEASDWLDADLVAIEATIASLFSEPPEQKIVDALGSFGYNLGATALARSQLATLIKAGKLAECAQSMMRFVHAGKATSDGLVARRFDESLLLLTGIYF